MDAKVEGRVVGRRAGAVAEIVFDNPSKLNAVSLDMWRTVERLLDEYAAAEDVRVLVLSGAGGKAFVSGADISKFESERSTKEAIVAYNAATSRAQGKLYGFPKPTIAKITGYCIGGGINIAICCDLRFCDEGARFGIPAARLGLGYGYVGVNRLAEVIGLARAMEMFYTARQFTAAEAEAMGLVNRALPGPLLDAYIDDYTQRIADNAPLTIATIKAVAREISKPPAERDLAKLDALVQACFDSKDYVEGRRAFMEKRKPRFTGK